MIGIDVIPAQPPRGVSTIQGNFLSSDIQDDVRAYVRDPTLGRQRKQTISEEPDGLTEAQVDELERGYIDIERQAHMEGITAETQAAGSESSEAKLSVKERDLRDGRVVDVVLSDMSEPWDQVAGFYKKSLSDPYFRMMNTSGNPFRDHAGSMVRGNGRVSRLWLICQDLCMAALTFAFDTVKTGGHFLCKFYQGSEEKAFETKLKRLFAKVSREKPESSRAVGY